MTPLKGLVTVSTVTLWLGACVTAPPAVEPTLPIGHHFAYAIDQRERLQLVQVFDDSSKTYLQFRRAPIVPVLIRATPDGSALGYVREGIYVVIDGVFPSLMVQLGDKTATITNNQPVAAAATRPEPAAISMAEVAPTTAATAVETSSAAAQITALQSDIVTLQEKIHTLSHQLAIAQSTATGATLIISEVNGVSRVVVHFGDNRSDVQIDPNELAMLGTVAEAADHIYLHGRTDAIDVTPAATTLAIARVVSVKQLLVSLGVEPTRVRMFYRSAGSFAADNHTDAGRAANRRVEIQLFPS